jgi:DNA (cytosine-5)-methyltransferase 1
VFFVASKFGEILPPQHTIRNVMQLASVRDAIPKRSVPGVKVSVFDAIADLLTVPLLPKQNTQVVSPDWEKGEYAKYLEEIFPNPGVITNKITGFIATTHTPEVIEQFINTPPGAREAKSRAKKLEWDGLCVTLRAGSGNRTALRPIHPCEPRVISVREAARLHSFPDWFNFSEGILHAHREIGNSVPPLLAYAVGMQIREHLESHVSDTLLCKARSLRDESRSPNLFWVCLHRYSKGSWDNHRYERFGFANQMPLLHSLNITSKERYAERKVFGLSPPSLQF